METCNGSSKSPLPDPDPLLAPPPLLGPELGSDQRHHPLLLQWLLPRQLLMATAFEVPSRKSRPLL